jgi:hypothetical protein
LFPSFSELCLSFSGNSAVVLDDEISLVKTCGCTGSVGFLVRDAFPVGRVLLGAFLVDRAVVKISSVVEGTILDDEIDVEVDFSVGEVDFSVGKVDFSVGEVDFSVGEVEFSVVEVDFLVGDVAVGFWAVEVGFWVIEVGFSVVEVGFLVVEVDFWVVDVDFFVEGDGVVEGKVGKVTTSTTVLNETVKCLAK